MPTIETDLKEIFTKIDQRLDRMEQKIDSNQAKTDESLNDIKVSQAEIKGEIRALDEKTTGLGKRLENQEFTNRGILVGVILALIGGAAKLFGIFPNP